MKTMRYLLITFAVMMVVSTSAQSLAQQPTTEFHSTSSMVGSGSTLPMAVENGVSTTYESNVAHNSSAQKAPPKPPGPNENPIGEGMWALLLAAAVYGVWCRVYKRKRV